MARGRFREVVLMSWWWNEFVGFLVDYFFGGVLMFVFLFLLVIIVILFGWYFWSSWLFWNWLLFGCW